MATSLEDLGTKTNNSRATMLGNTLTEATKQLLDNRKSPSRKVREIDNRGSHFYIAMYWAQAMAKHDPSFTELSEELANNHEKIVNELIECQGDSIDVGGYYMPDDDMAAKAMRPSETFNKL